MIEVAVEGTAPERGQPVHRLRTALGEGFRAAEVLGFLELARVRAQVAVAYVEERLELAEAELLAHRECAENAEPHALVHQAVEPRVLALTAPAAERGEARPLV